MVVIYTTTSGAMFESVLREAGLSPNEARVYEALVDLKEASVEVLSTKSKVHRRNIYDCLSKLLDKGLVSEAFVSGKKRYKAINPSRLLDMVQEKAEKIKAGLPELQKRFSAVEVVEEAYFYKGIQGVKNYLQDILDVGETVYFIGAKAFWLDPRLQHFLPSFQRERRKKGIKFMHLFDYEVKEQKPDILKFVGRPYKFIPKQYSSPTCVDIFGDRVVTFVGVKPGQLCEEPIQFVLRSRQLADGYRKFFQFMWDHCD